MALPAFPRFFRQPPGPFTLSPPRPVFPTGKGGGFGLEVEKKALLHFFLILTLFLDDSYQEIRTGLQPWSLGGFAWGGPGCRTEMRFYTDTLPARARIYISAILAAGGPLVLYSGWRALVDANLSWVFLAALALASSRFPIRIPYNDEGHSVKITTSDLFIFAALLMYGPEVAVLVAALDAAMGGSRTRRLYRILFGLSLSSCTTFLLGTLFYWMLGVQPPLPMPVENPWAFLAAVTFFALLFFLLNSAGITLVLALTTERPCGQIWIQHFRWVFLPQVAVALAAATIFLHFERTQFLVFGLALPLVLVLHYAYRMNRQRTETLLASQDFLQSTLNSLSSYIAILDGSGRILAVNAGWQHHAGESELFGAGFPVGSNYLQDCRARQAEGEAPEKLAEGIQSVISGQSQLFHYEYVTGGEQPHWFTVRVTPFEGNGPHRAVVAHQEVTDLKQAEEALRSSQEQLRQAQKMEAVGRLAGGVAHDFNNILTAILGYTELLLMELSEEDAMYESLQEIRSAANRAADLTRQLLTFSRKQVLQPRIVDLGAMARDTEKMLRRLIGADVELRVKSEPNLYRVKADPGQLEQVIMNLVINSRDAMPHGGEITLSVRNLQVNEPVPCQTGELLPGTYVLLEVRDTGSGMDQETLARIFEPFFTTKEKGKGTGLGLSTVYGIIQQSGGQILVETAPGQGTCFRIFLPRAEGKEPSREEVPPRLPAPPPAETVLVVEDEETVRWLTRCILEKEGYRVLEAPHGNAALNVCRRHHGPIHLMITDVVMPHMDGGKLAELLGPVRPEMKILFMSGYAESTFLRKIQDGSPSGRDFLAKPFTSEVLTHKVRRLLNKSA